MTRPFRFQPLDQEPSPYTKSVEDVCRTYPDMAVGEAMACVYLHGKIDWEAVAAIADRRGLVRRADKRTESVQEDRPTPDAHAPAPKPAMRSKANGNGFPTEASFTSAALKELKKLPRCKFFRANVGRARGVSFGEVGQPDIFGLLPGGHFLGLELKQPGGKLSPQQEAWHRQALDLGCTILVCETLDEVIRGVVEAMR